MQEASDKLQEVLGGDATMANLVGGKIYWELGKDNEKPPLIAYSITKNPGQSKDSESFSASIRCYGGNMLESAQIASAVEAAMKEARQLFRGGQSGVTDDESREAVIELNYNLKL